MLWTLIPLGASANEAVAWREEKFSDSMRLVFELGASMSVVVSIPEPWSVELDGILMGCEVWHMPGPRVAMRCVWRCWLIRGPTSEPLHGIGGGMSEEECVWVGRAVRLRSAEDREEGV